MTDPTVTTADAASHAASPTNLPTSAQDAIKRRMLSLIKSRGGMLSGSELYFMFGERQESDLRAIAEGLERQGQLTIKGDVYRPLGIFHAMLVLTQKARLEIVGE